jgi:glycosyltransferase involved in cell wall biosynthesis
MQSYYDIEPKRISIMPFGEYTFLAEGPMPDRAAARREVGIPGAGPVVLFFGHLRKYKGLNHLIRAFVKVRQLVPDAILLIAGSPKKDTDSKVFRSLVADLGLEKAVRFHLRYIPSAEVPNYFVTADVVALPYVAISQSAVLQAAYAFSRPVVATRVGGLPEAVLDGESGLLVPPGDVSALADAVVAMLRDPSRARAMGEKGRRLAEAAHGWENIGRRTKRVYERVMS